MPPLVTLLACTLFTGAEPPAEGPSTPSPSRGEQHPADNDEKPDVGRWNRARGPAVSDEVAQLEALGYVGGDQAPGEQVGVTRHTEAAWDGVNLYVSGHAAEAVLLDMDGRELHRWSKPFRDLWPDRPVGVNAHGPEFWRRAALLADGSLLAIYEGHGLVKLDRDNEVVWAWDGRAHHDLEVLDDGRIWVLSRKIGVVEGMHPERPVLEDFATLLSPEGHVLDEISLLDASRNPDAEGILARVPRRHGDVYHTNSLALLDGRVEHPAFRAGNLLLSMRATSTIAVLDPEARKIVWWHHGDYARQHDPKILEDGRLLLFDNLGAGRDRSAVREYTLPGMEQVWSYEGSDQAPFFSRFCGASERLPNGNTLISESGIGRVFEITPEGQVVWEFHNPARAGDGGEFVAIVPELIRYPRSHVAGWL